MAFMVIVYCTTNDDAQRLVDDENYRAVGVYRWPSKKELSCGGQCLNGWSRNPRGYIVCGGCGGRHKHTTRRFIKSLFDYLGCNFLPRDATPRLFQNPETWDAAEGLETPADQALEA